jgi:hypothetical protein
MLKDPSRLGFHAKNYTAPELTFMITVFTAAASAWVFFTVQKMIFLYFLIPFPGIILTLLWIKGNALNRTQTEFLQSLPSWQEKRFHAAWHFRGNYRPNMQPEPGDSNSLMRSEDIKFILNQLDSVCEHDSKNLFGHEFFREHFWPILKLHWIYAHDRIIDEQKIDPHRWRYIFTTYKKYRNIFNDHATDDPHERLLRRELNETDPNHNLY